MKYLACLLLCSSFLFSQVEQLIVDSEDFNGNLNNGKITFIKNVKMKMGKDKLNANKVEAFFITKKGSSRKVPSKYIATGNAYFEIHTATKHYIGKGQKIIYSPIIQEFTVIGDGFLQEKNDGRKLYGNKIYVNQITGEASVTGNKNKPVRFIINIEHATDLKGKK